MIRQFISVVAAVSIFAAIAYAHGGERELPPAGIVPGDFFYFLEIMSEGIGSLFVFGDTRNIDRSLHLAEKRLAEAEELASRGDAKHAEKAIKRYEKHLESALARAESVKEKVDKPSDDVLAVVTEATAWHWSVLLGVYDKAPEEARDGIKHAIEQSVGGHEMSRAAISENRLGEIDAEIDELIRDAEIMLGDIEAMGIPTLRMHKEDDLDDEDVGEPHKNAAKNDVHTKDNDTLSDDIEDLEDGLNDDLFEGIESDLNDISGEL